jgi:two-component system, NarL family, nitrate/nitrite response regulator NarL
LPRKHSDAVRVFVVAGVRIHRDALVRLLHGKGELQVIGSAANAATAITAVGSAEPHLFLVDTATVDCPSAVRALRTAIPAAKIVALGVPESVDGLLAFAEAGVSSYVTSEQSLDDLVAAIEGAACGEVLASPRVTAALLERVGSLAAERGPMPEDVRLTSREAEIVELIARGLSNKQIGQALCIELATVKNHVHHILVKLKVKRRSEAAARWRSGATQAARVRAAANGGLAMVGLSGGESGVGRI